MNWNNIHLVKSKNLNLIFHCPTYSIMTVNDEALNAIKMLQEGHEVENIISKYGNKDSIHNFIRSITEMLSMEDLPTIEKQHNDRRKIRRITLHVSNDCNLRCKYCYAEGGCYNQNRKLMNFDTAEKFIDFCVKTFDSINQIIFFGGEPLLNIPVMEFICKKFKSNYEKKRSSLNPYFGMITNGTLYSEKVLEFIKEHISIITVSIDGPEDINDENRIFKDGRGSYQKIAKFIHALSHIENLVLQYESTYTKSHIDRGYSHLDIIRSLHEEFNINGFISDEFESLSENFTNELKSLNYENLISTNFIDLPDSFWSILHAIIYKEKRKICGISKDIIAVNTEGDIYPCHILNGKSHFCLGNIANENIFNNPSAYQFFPHTISFKENIKCKNCWAKNLCSICPLKGFLDESTNSFVREPNPDECEKIKDLIEQILIIIANIRKNPDIWKALLEKEKINNI